MNPDEFQRLLKYLTPAERRELEDAMRVPLPLWAPQKGPQTAAYHSTADVIGYGGAGGGGKTDLAIGKALTQHQVVAFFRKEGTELTGAIERMAEIVGHRTGLGGKPAIWRNPGGTCRFMEFVSVPNPGDEEKYRGRAKDLLIVDEATGLRESQVRFLMGWVRSVDPNQRCQTLLCFNPPSDVEGRWVVKFFAPWLDKKHPNRAKPGELRWFAMIDGRETEVSSGARIMHRGEEIIPQSRTFIPARISDNAYLRGTGYMAQLQALPEPLRSQLLYGDFDAGVQDDPQQVIPTEWVEAAMKRWQPMPAKPPMDSLGADIARGGNDNTMLARRHGVWYDEMVGFPGTQTPDGETAAALILMKLRDRAVIHLDVIGVGGSPYDVLRNLGQQVVGVNVSNSADATDKSGLLRFSNLRSQLWWQFREALDPVNSVGVCLPPDPELLAELCSAKWRTVGRTVYVSSRDEIIDDVGRSPDRATAVILAWIKTPKIAAMASEYSALRSGTADYNPFDLLRGDRS